MSHADLAAALNTFVYALVALLVIFDPAGTAALFAALTPTTTVPNARNRRSVLA